MQLELSTNKQMQAMLEDAGKKIPGFMDKLRVTYEEKDLEGFQSTVAREKAAAKEVPEIYKMSKKTDEEGKEVPVAKFGMYVIGFEFKRISVQYSTLQWCIHICRVQYSTLQYSSIFICRVQYSTLHWYISL